MGVGHLVIYSGWKLVDGGRLRRPLSADAAADSTRATGGSGSLLFFGDDLSYYAYHRSHHRIRIFWATHVVHHSSQHYNLSTALRQDWTPFSVDLLLGRMPLIGFQPWMIFLAISWNLLYQFWIHTETIGKTAAPVECVFNTPSHHRVHHGSQQQYLDRNYGGILIIWDRMFGTFEPEGERVRYGLTKNIETFNPFRVAFHEWRAIWPDVRAAKTWRDRLGYLFKGPGWKPGQPATAGEVAEPAVVAVEEPARAMPRVRLDPSLDSLNYRPRIPDRGARIRTGDLSPPKRARYQASLHPAAVESSPPATDE